MPLAVCAEQPKTLGDHFIDPFVHLIKRVQYRVANWLILDRTSLDDVILAFDFSEVDPEALIQLWLGDQGEGSTHDIQMGFVSRTVEPPTVGVLERDLCIAQ
jgi:hypothetical protein